MPERKYNFTVRRQVQNRHIEGTKEYNEYAAKLAEKGFKPSILNKNINVAELVRKFHKKGIYDPNPKDGSPREIVNTGRIIGKYWDKDKCQYIDTAYIEIVYSKYGVHIYPIFFEGDDEQ